ncbi:hypothetical protein GW534_15595 [Bacillus sp. P1(2020)]|uniref:Uncharacterized protein n=2 Tax=Pallidibacillus pasinlerensis TaxID=2703818 RepID=A0ABX0ACA7_9BACI|nr:hypothetical protein [Pallidibacillus pasinlerensis]
MNIVAKGDGIGSSKFELWLFKFLHVLTFKKSLYVKKVICQIEADIEAKKNKHV